MFFGILIGIISVGAMIYLALNKKSDFHVRLASLGALALMVLTLIICIVAYVTGGDAPVDWSTFVVSDEPVKQDKDESGDILIIVFSIIFFLALFAIIFALAMKEHKKSLPKKGSVII